MNKNTLQKIRYKNGFSLLELAVVITVMGTIIAISAPNFINILGETGATKRLAAANQLNSCLVNLHLNQGWGKNILTNAAYQAQNDGLDVCIAGEDMILPAQRKGFQSNFKVGLRDLVNIDEEPEAGSKKGTYIVEKLVMRLSPTQTPGSLSVDFLSATEEQACELMSKVDAVDVEDCDFSKGNTKGDVTFPAPTDGFTTVTLKRSFSL